MHLTVSILIASVLLPSVAAAQTSERPPNLVLIMADDLGWGELGCYGQTKIETPHLDRLAVDGMRFTQHYSGAPVCAPSRCVLLTARHSGHAFVRDNKEIQPEGQLALPADEVTIAEQLRAAGYVTGAFGKWGLGPPGSEGAPEHQGFDHFLGYNCQRQAHNFYPTHLWRDGAKLPLDNRAFKPYHKITEPLANASDYDVYRGSVYAPDVMLEGALAFIDRYHDEPFFLYVPNPIPHVALQIPESDLAPYIGRFEETPYLGTKGYVPNATPRATYAAMITRLDREVGQILERLDAHGLAENTLVIFTSDNGPTYAGGVDPEFFDSAGGLRGLKGSIWEGGIRVPLIARWPGRIPAGTVSGLPSAFQDIGPTLCAAAGAAPMAATDGISFLPTLEGRAHEQPRHPYLYWGFSGYGGQEAVRCGRWKAVRRQMHKGPGTLQLFDLVADPAETTDVAADHPVIARELAAIMRANHTPSAAFPFPFKDTPAD